MTLRFPRIFRTLVGANYAFMLEYRAEIFLWVLAGITPFLMMGVWSQVIAQRPGTTMTASDVVRYFTAAFIVRQFTIVWVIWEFEYRVVEGRLSSALLKPVDPVWEFVSMHVAEQFTRLPFWAVIVAIAWAIHPAAFHTDRPWLLPLAAASIALVFTLRFAMQYTFAMLCFWLERASSIEQITFLPYMYLSGYLIPWEMYSPSTRAILELTPFPYLLAFPVGLLTGKPIIDPLRGFIIMAAWTLLFVILNRLLWHKGLRHYSGMGA